jgi:hypothetical protein
MKSSISTSINPAKHTLTFAKEKMPIFKAWDRIGLLKTSTGEFGRN